MHICVSEQICCLPEPRVASNVTARGPGPLRSRSTCHCSLVPPQRRPPAGSRLACKEWDPPCTCAAGPSVEFRGRTLGGRLGAEGILPGFGVRGLALNEGPASCL